MLSIEKVSISFFIEKSIVIFFFIVVIARKDLISRIMSSFVIDANLTANTLCKLSHSVVGNLFFSFNKVLCCSNMLKYFSSDIIFSSKYFGNISLCSFFLYCFFKLSI